jgi:hypothetical protein
LLAFGHPVVFVEIQEKDRDGREAREDKEDVRIQSFTVFSLMGHTL